MGHIRGSCKNLNCHRMSREKVKGIMVEEDDEKVGGDV